MNTKISKKGFSSIIFFLTQGMFIHVGITEILNSTENNSLLAIIIGTFISLIILFFILKFCNYEKDLTLFQKLEKIFGKTLGKILNLLLTILFFLYFSYMLWSVNTYIQNKYLNSTPSIIIILLFLIPTVWCVLTDMKTLSKVSLSLFFITLFMIIFSISNLFIKIDLENFKPLFNIKLTPLLKTSLIYTSYFVTPTFMMITVPKNMIYDSKNLTKTVTKLYIFSSINFLLLFIFIIGIFGIDLAKQFSYPEYTLMKKVNYFDFIQHIENITTIQWLYCLFISNVMSLNFIKEYLKHINHFKYKIFIPIVLIALILSLNLFKNTTVAYTFVTHYYHYLYSVPILILLLLSCLIIKRKNT